jgi:hypothetical protein
VAVIRYTKGAEVPGVDYTWPEPDGTLYNFSTGWTFTARIGVPGQPALLQKTTGFTGAATAPNLVFAGFTAGELDAIPAGTYHLDVIPRITATSQDLQPSTRLFQILDGVLAP